MIIFEAQHTHFPCSDYRSVNRQHPGAKVKPLANLKTAFFLTPPSPSDVL